MGQGPSGENVNGVGTDLDDAAPFSIHSSSSFSSPHTLTDRVRQMVTDDFDDDASANELSSFQEASAETVATRFCWSHGGDQVFITGSFNQWSGKIPMERSSNDAFTLTLDILPGKHQYRFLVDDEWRYAPDQPSITDAQGVRQNEIEVDEVLTRDVSFPNEYDEDPTKVPYDNLCPAADDYSKKDPPLLPPHLGFVLLNADSERISEGNVVAPTLPVPQHVTLNHFYTSLSPQDDVLVVGSTQRYKSKFVTTVYYRPKETGTKRRRVPQDELLCLRASDQQQSA